MEPSSDGETSFSVPKVTFKNTVIKGIIEYEGKKDRRKKKEGYFLPRIKAKTGDG